MTNDLNDPALRGLLRERDIIHQEMTKQLQTLDEEIARRRHALMNLDSTNETAATIPRKQWVRFSTADALETYLEERGGGPIKLDQVAADLAVAGVKLSKKPGREIQNIKITLSAAGNHKRFAYDESTDTVSLVRATTPKPPARAR